MADVELLLRNYGQEVNDRCPPITVVELEHHVELTATDDQGVDGVMVDYLQQRPDESDAPFQWKGWSGVVVAVAATILVVVGVVVAADGETRDIATESIASVAVADPVSYQWSRVPHDEAVFGGAGGQRMNSVTTGGPGLVAVGAAEHDEDADAAVWTSADGITWSRVPHDEAVFGGAGGQRMNSVTAGGPGLVAVGAVGHDWDGDAAVWTSADGITWLRVPHDEAVFGGPGGQRMNSVTAGGPGLVAVGSYGGPPGSDGKDVAAVWTSVDGITWLRVPHDEAVFGGLGREAMNSVTAGGAGLVAVGSGVGRFAVGENRTLTWQVHAPVWTSVDGLIWTRIPIPDDGTVFGTNSSLHSVTAGGPGLVAVGKDADAGCAGDDECAHWFSDAAVWTSVDGTTWSRVPHDETIFGGDDNQTMNSVTARGTSLVAVGTAGTDDDEYYADQWAYPDGWAYTRPDAAVWTSVDGLTWSRAPHDEAVSPDSEMHSVTVTDTGLVAIGSESLPGATYLPGCACYEPAELVGSALVWVAEPEP